MTGVQTCALPICGVGDGDHTLFVAGNDEAAKKEVLDLAESFGWQRDNMLDLGDVTAARGMEMYLPLWLRIFGAAGTPIVNVEVRSGA